MFVHFTFVSSVINLIYSKLLVLLKSELTEQNFDKFFRQGCLSKDPTVWINSALDLPTHLTQPHSWVIHLLKQTMYPPPPPQKK